MKYYLLILTVLSHMDTWCSDKTPLTVSNTSNLISRRRYFIHRLRPTINLLEKMYLHLHKKPHYLDIPQLTHDLQCASPFRCQQIRHSILAIQHTRNLRPLFLVWNDFAAYKRLEDTIFVEEFSKEIFVITRNAMLAVSGHADTTRYQTIPDTIDHALDTIDCMTRTIKGAVPLGDIQDIAPAAHIDDITERLYHIERIRKAVLILELLEQKIEKVTQKGNHLAIRASDYQTSEQFTNERIIAAIQQIQSSGSIKPLLRIWRDVKQYKAIDDRTFVKEFLHCLFYVLRAAYLVYAHEEGSNLLTISTEVSLEALSIEQTLHMIDLIVDEIADVFENDEPKGITDYLMVPVKIILTLFKKE